MPTPALNTRPGCSGTVYALPVVDDDGDFIWERSAPAGWFWEVIWCTPPNVKGTCSRWTLL